MSIDIRSEPRKPDCDVCDWATAYYYAHGMNLCKADLELADKVAQQERERIIKLLEQEGHRLGSSETRYFRRGLAKAVELIKGENK